jgi:hypothetical protein
LQLNTGRGADANPKVDFLGIDACWMAFYVLCRNVGPGRWWIATVEGANSRINGVIIITVY